MSHLQFFLLLLKDVLLLQNACRWAMQRAIRGYLANICGSTAVPDGTSKPVVEAEHWQGEGWLGECPGAEW